MGDRDFPSIPIPTLAGLTSLSDLLTELPISDPISIQTSLNKTLLFHPRVGEEANNLLADNDQNLVQQLVQAIEQTNLDHIELKDEYAEVGSCNVTSDMPQLLRAIYNYKPNVFNNPVQQQPHIVDNKNCIQNQFLQNEILSHQNNAQSYHVQQYQTHQNYPSNSYNQQIIMQHGLQQSSIENFNLSNQNLENYFPNDFNEINISQIGDIHGTPTVLTSTSHTRVQANQAKNFTPVQGPTHIVHQPWSPENNKNYAANVITYNSNLLQQEQEQQQQQFLPQTNIHNQQIINEGYELQTQPTITQTCIPAIQQPSVQQKDVVQLNSGNQVSTIVTCSPLSAAFMEPIPDPSRSNKSNLTNQIINSSQQLPTANQNNNSIEKHQDLNIIKQNSINQKIGPKNSDYLEKKQENLESTDPLSTQSNEAVIKNTNSGSSANHHNNQINTSLKDETSFQNSNISGNNNIEQSVNNSNSTVETLSLPQEMISLENISSLNLKTPKVSLRRIKTEDFDMMQESISRFIEKSPKTAKAMGLEKEDYSIFSKMKADEDSLKSLGKRKHPDRVEEIPISQPKLRKVERKVVKAPTKITKDDIIKSNTYIRFMSTMDQILEMLDDPDALINSDDNYDNVDCIPTNMLMSLSAEAAKLKAKGNAIELLPQNKLTLLINYAMRNLHVAKDISAGPDMGEDLVTEDCLDKIVNAIEASLLICNIYSCRSASALQEDNVDLIIKFIQFQLRETIFPSHDPVYSVETKKKNKKNSKNNQQREMSRLYSKIVELTKVMVTLLSKFQFEDTIIIHASALGIEPFFVDNIETLQFVCLDLVTTIFQNDKYLKHRGNILSEILTSIDRLPHSKRNLRPYKLTNNSGNIQMITALVLQLIQCSVILPETMMGVIKKPVINPINRSKKSNQSQQQPIENANKEDNTKIENDICIREKYDTAVSIGGNFLSTFLNKCRSRSGETDFRPIFENFITDLLTTVNKPEWPAAELLLSLLGTLLVNSMSNKSVDQALRVVSLEYLGIVAARLRKDTVVSRCKVNTMDKLIELIKIEQVKEGDKDNDNPSIEIDAEEERTEFLQRILLDFLAVNAQDENIVWSHSRHFYLTQWYRDIMQRKKKIAEGEKGYASRKKLPKKRRKYKNQSDSSEDEEDEISDDEKLNNSTTTDQSLNLEIFRILDKRKEYLLSKISPYSDNPKVQDIKTYIDYNNAQLIAQYLASKRSFSQSFDKYLQKIILVVREQSIAIRTKAMKCLAVIVEVDPTILARKDMQMGVNQKFLDTSISVREAAVDLVGKYVLTSPDLINQYYEMLSVRILDTGVSVRKRVIKILRDICVGYPDFDKIPEICVKMIRRVNDEDGIQKLVTEVFLSMWFTPCKENDKHAIQRKIYQIIDVVNSSHDSGMQWLDGLLKTIFQSKESKEDTTVRKEPSKLILQSCQQIVDGLVDALMRLEEENDCKKLLGCVTTMNLFAKVRPQLIIQHAITIEPYLNIKCNSSDIAKFISVVAEILEQVVPLMEHPSEIFLSDLETHLMMLIVAHNQQVVLTCIACLAAVVNKITKNFKLIRDCLAKYYNYLMAIKEKIVADSTYSLPVVPFLRRCIFLVGLFMRYFDFSDPDVYGTNINNTNGIIYPADICDKVFQTLMIYLTCNNHDIRKETLKSLGFFCVTNYEYLTKPELQTFYHDLLTLDTIPPGMKTIVLRNILTYLYEEEQKHLRNEMEWVKKSHTEDLKEMGDVSSGMSSRIIQLYLKDILNCFLQPDYHVRLWSMKVADVVLKQGLVHPVQIVPYLICLSTDTSKEIAHSADYHLQDIDKNHSGFINMKTYAGIHLSFELQTTLQFLNSNVKIVRGYRINSADETPAALNGFLYSLLRTTKPQRRALVQSITKQFDDQRTSLRQMLYLADNLAYFPYLVLDEPLYIIHQIDVLISNTGTNLLSNFKEGLTPLPNSNENQPEIPLASGNPIDDDEEDDKDVLYSRLPEDLLELQNCIRSAQGCMLLLILKQHLKDSYGITDGKIAQYSPSESTKTYDKQMQRRNVQSFNPSSTIEVIKEEETIDDLSDEVKRKELITRYLDFKQLMLKLDPEDPDQEDDDEDAKNKAAGNNGETANAPNANSMGETEQKTDSANKADQTTTSVPIPTPVPVTATVKKDTSLRSTRHSHTPVNKSKSTPRRSEPKKKKKKKNFSSSSEESDYSDPDYE